MFTEPAMILTQIETTFFVAEVSFSYDCKLSL